MLAALLTLVTAGLLGGAIAADVTEIAIVAAVALVLIGIYSGLCNYASLCDLARDQRGQRLPR